MSSECVLLACLGGDGTPTVDIQTLLCVSETLEMLVETEKELKKEILIYTLNLAGQYIFKSFASVL